SGSVSGAFTSLIGHSINVIDSHTLNLQLSAPAPYFLEAMTYPTADAEPQQLISRYGNSNWTSHLADNGGIAGNLYKVQTWDHAGNIVLARNANFWGAPPKLREVDFKIYQSSSAEYADYLSGLLSEGSAPAAQYSASKARSDFHELPYLQINYFQ